MPSGLETLRGKSRRVEAVKVTRDRVFDPVLLSYEHLGDGWLIGAGTLRHSTKGGWVADSSKAALAARVVGAKVHASLASPTAADARAELRRDSRARAERP